MTTLARHRSRTDRASPEMPRSKNYQNLKKPGAWHFPVQALVSRRLIFERIIFVHFFINISKSTLDESRSKEICLNFGHFAGFPFFHDIPHGSFGPNNPLSNLPLPLLSWKQRIPYSPFPKPSNLYFTLFSL